MTAEQRRRAVMLGTAVASVAVLAWWLPFGSWAVARAEWLRAQGAMGMALFIVGYVVAELLLVPGSLLTLAAGFAYGPVVGMFVAVPASVLAATVSFLVARTVLREWIRVRVQQHPGLRALDTAVGRNSFVLILLLRLSPAVPFNLLNYALGLSNAKIGRYVMASLVGMLPGTWLYVYLGAVATSALELTSVATADAPQRAVMIAVGGAATVAAFLLLARATRRALAEQASASG